MLHSTPTPLLLLLGLLYSMLPERGNCHPFLAKNHDLCVSDVHFHVPKLAERQHGVQAISCCLKLQSLWRNYSQRAVVSIQRNKDSDSDNLCYQPQVKNAPTSRASQCSEEDMQPTTCAQASQALRALHSPQREPVSCSVQLQVRDSERCDEWDRLCACNNYKVVHARLF